MCDRSAPEAENKLECVDGKCAKAGAPTTAPETTTPPPCSGNGGMCYDGATAEVIGECCNGVFLILHQF